MRLTVLLALAVFAAANVYAEPIPYGVDSGQYTRDGECDDPRFTGPGVVTDNDWTSAGRDATDCKKAVTAGATFWYDPSNLTPVACDVTDFGDDSSSDANDGYCDDNRFFGMTSGINFAEDNGKDATDCEAACEAKTIFVYPGPGS